MASRSAPSAAVTFPTAYSTAPARAAAQRAAPLRAGTRAGAHLKDLRAVAVEAGR